MGCIECGSGGQRDAAGCQGNCSSGSCNRKNVFNWLADIPVSDLRKPFPFVEITFNHGSRKGFYKNNTNHTFNKGDYVAVEAGGGFDVGQINLAGELVKWQMKKKKVSRDNPKINKLLRPASEGDMAAFREAKSREADILLSARAIVRAEGLKMKVTQIEVQSDGKKITFFYTAETRVDFRQLIKIYATKFKAKIEMRQIGLRQEASKLGGIGSCGRELCCSTWLSDFKSVSTSAARYQGLSINQAKLSGQCGRLKCCLNFELDTYMDALKHFPKNAETLQLASGEVRLKKRDIFRELMWYSFDGKGKQYPLKVERVKEIQELNKKGIKPKELKETEIRSRHQSDNPDTNADMGFVNDVGQISLSSLNKTKPKKKNKRKKKKSKYKSPYPKSKREKSHKEHRPNRGNKRG